MPLFLNTDTSQRLECSEETSRMIDHEVRQLLEEARERVHRDLSAKRATLEALGVLLIEREVIDREALDGLMATGDRTARVPSATAAPAAGELGISAT